MRLGRPCNRCLAPGGRLAGLAGKGKGLVGGIVGGAAGLARGVINNQLAHDCQTPYTQPYAQGGMGPGGMGPQTSYPYYTTRAPRDFLDCTPPSIGP